MSEPASDYHHGDMDITEQQATYRLFGGLTKWGSLATVVLLLPPIFWFCVKTDFFSGLVPAIVVLVLGILFLRSPAEH